MSQAHTVSASFVVVYTLAVTKTGSGAGAVTSNVGGINCGGTCAVDYDDGTVVTLTAAASAGSRFAGWSGEGCSGTGTCTVTMSQARNVTANFVAIHTLTVAKTGSGTGTVTSDVGAINCGVTCADDVRRRQLGHAHRGRFRGLPLRRLVGRGLLRNRHLHGHDEPGPQRQRQLHRSPHPDRHEDRIGHGHRDVRRRRDRLWRHLRDDYDEGTSVTLSAPAASGSRFTGWSGAGCSGTGTCTVAMSQARNVSAGFVAAYTLTVTKTGSGSGTVSSDVGAINCGATCSDDYDDGTLGHAHRGRFRGLPLRRLVGRLLGHAAPARSR